MNKAMLGLLLFGILSIYVGIDIWLSSTAHGIVGLAISLGMTVAGALMIFMALKTDSFVSVVDNIAK